MITRLSNVTPTVRAATTLVYPVSDCIGEGVVGILPQDCFSCGKQFSTQTSYTGHTGIHRGVLHRGNTAAIQSGAAFREEGRVCTRKKYQYPILNMFIFLNSDLSKAHYIILKVCNLTQKGVI